MPDQVRVTELEVAMAVVAYLRSKLPRQREASFKELTFILPGAWLTLNPADREWQRHRKGEQKWHAVLRNIGAHTGQPGNAITEGALIKRVGGGYALPTAANSSSTVCEIVSRETRSAP